MERKGQGTTEYLIILAVIIVVALVVVGVMGWFPGLGTGITEQQSKAYWASTSPIAIKDWQITTDDTQATFAVQNLTTDSVGISGMTVGGETFELANDVNLAAGGSGTISGVITGIACPTAGNVYQYDVTITYSVAGGLAGKTQTGQKPIIGTCVT